MMGVLNRLFLILSIPYSNSVLSNLSKYKIKSLRIVYLANEANHYFRICQYKQV